MRPDVFSKQDFHVASFIFNEVCENFKASSIVESVDCPVSMYTASIDQLLTREFARSVPTPSFITFNEFSLDEGKSGYVVIEIDPAISGALLSGMAKNPSHGQRRARGSRGVQNGTKFTEAIMCEVSDAVLGMVTTSFSQLFQNAGGKRIHSNFNVNKLDLPKNDMGLLATLELKVGVTEGMVNCFFDVNSLEALRELTRKKSGSAGVFERLTSLMGRSYDESKKIDFGSFDDAEVIVAARIFKKNITIRDLLKTIGKNTKGIFEFGDRDCCAELIVGGSKLNVDVLEVSGRKHKAIQTIKKGER